MILFMGVAGAGKSVQGQLLAKHLDYTWLSTGDYLRNHINDERRKQMEAGKLLNDVEIIHILQQFFDEIKDPEHCIIDGFPRTLTQAKWLIEQHTAGNLTVHAIIYLNASKEVVSERLMARGRPDDTEEAIMSRFEQYEELTLPIIDWFKEQGMNLFEIDAEPDVETVQRDIQKQLEV